VCDCVRVDCTDIPCNLHSEIGICAIMRLNPEILECIYLLEEERLRCALRGLAYLPADFQTKIFDLIVHANSESGAKSQ
jgi:hypothetical protein